jgi:streptomycin 6-kinase
VLGESLIVVPAELAELHEKYSGEEGRTWIAGLPALAAAYLDRWQLTIDGPAASGAVALIVPVTRRDGSLDRSRAAGWSLGRVLQVAVWDLVRFREGSIWPSHRAIAEVLAARYAG